MSNHRNHLLEFHLWRAKRADAAGRIREQGGFGLFADESWLSTEFVADLFGEIANRYRVWSGDI